MVHAHEPQVLVPTGQVRASCVRELVHLSPAGELRHRQVVDLDAVINHHDCEDEDERKHAFTALHTGSTVNAAISRRTWLRE